MNKFLKGAVTWMAEIVIGAAWVVVMMAAAIVAGVVMIAVISFITK